MRKMNVTRMVQCQCLALLLLFSGAAAFGVSKASTSRLSLTTTTSSNARKTFVLSMQLQANAVGDTASSSSQSPLSPPPLPLTSVDATSATSSLGTVSHSTANSPTRTSLSSVAAAAEYAPPLEQLVVDGLAASVADATESLGLVTSTTATLDEPSTTTANSAGWNLTNPSVVFARLLIVAAAAVYGTNFSMVKLLDDQMPYQVSAVLRFGLAAVVVSALVLNGERTENANNNNTKEDVEQAGTKMAAMLGGAEIGGWYCLGYLAQAIGLQTADASKSAFFNTLAVIVVPLLDSAIKGRKLGFQGVVSIVLAIMGVGLLQLGPQLGNLSAGGAAALLSNGDAFCLAQAFLFGIGYWRLEALAQKYPTQGGRLTVGQLGGVALGTTVFAAAMGNVPTLAQLGVWLTDPFVVGALLWTALVSTALALYLETVALKAVSASELTILMTSVSLFGSAFAYVTIGEVMTPLGMVGGMLILAGCLISALGGETETATYGPIERWSDEFKAAPLQEEQVLLLLPEQQLASNSTLSGVYR